MVKLGPGWTVTLTVADFVTPPPDPVIVSVKVLTAVATVVETASVVDPAPGAANVAGENAAVMPAGMPEICSATAALKVPTRLTDACPDALLPALMVMVDGTVSVKPGAGFTTSVRGTDFFIPPLVATIFKV
jgi:hypothetical protein